MSDSPLFVSIQNQSINLPEEIKLLGGNESVGATAMFLGSVRSLLRNVQSLELEHYSGMTEKALYTIAEAAYNQYSVIQIRVVHRVGILYPTEHIVFVGVTSSHRQNAFQACEYITDYLKCRAPFWKKENINGKGHWVSAKSDDEEKLNRWLT